MAKVSSCPSPEEKHAAEGRNGGTKKTLKGDFGEIELETPRDREGSLAVLSRRSSASGRCASWDSTTRSC
jgi:transposase-like protein